MMTYTESGLALMAAAVTDGIQIRFVRIELIADPERSQGTLKHEADIESVSRRDSTTILIKAVTDNYGFTKDYYFNQINVYAAGGDGAEVLFCFQKSTTCPFYIPQYDGRPVQNEIRIHITMAAAETVHLSNEGMYVLQSDFEDLKQTVLEKARIIITNETPMSRRIENVMYLRVTGRKKLNSGNGLRVSTNMGITTDEEDISNMKFAPYMGLRILKNEDFEEDI